MNITIVIHFKEYRYQGFIPVNILGSKAVHDPNPRRANALVNSTSEQGLEGLDTLFQGSATALAMILLSFLTTHAKVFSK